MEKISEFIRQIMEKDIQLFDAEIVDKDSFCTEFMGAVYKHSKIGKFSDEEVLEESSFLPTFKIKTISEQMEILEKFFSGIGCINKEIAEQPLLDGSEGFFAIPRWERIAPLYGEATRKVLEKIGEINKQFYNCCQGRLGSIYFRQSKRTIKIMDIICNEQKGNDVLVIPAQTGYRHRGRSARRAIERMAENEFGLNAFSVGIMILTHPEILDFRDDPWILCIGDEMSNDIGTDFSEVPCYRYFDDKIKFDSYWNGNMNPKYRAATGFLKQ